MRCCCSGIYERSFHVCATENSFEYFDTLNSSSKVAACCWLNTFFPSLSSQELISWWRRNLQQRNLIKMWMRAEHKLNCVVSSKNIHIFFWWWYSAHFNMKLSKELKTFDEILSLSLLLSLSFCEVAANSGEKYIYSSSSSSVASILEKH